MLFCGDFGGDPYLDDGWIINIWINRQGNTWVYIFVHEINPRYTGENGWFLDVGGGLDWKENSGEFISNC